MLWGRGLSGTDVYSTVWGLAGKVGPGEKGSFSEEMEESQYIGRVCETKIVRPEANRCRQVWARELCSGREPLKTMEALFSR